jgi:hypothetical protein
VPDVLVELSSGSGDLDDPGLDRDGDALGDGEVFGLEDVLHLRACGKSAVESGREVGRLIEWREKGKGRRGFFGTRKARDVSSSFDLTMLRPVLVLSRRTGTRSSLHPLHAQPQTTRVQLFLSSLVLSLASSRALTLPNQLVPSSAVRHQHQHSLVSATTCSRDRRADLGKLRFLRGERAGGRRGQGEAKTRVGSIQRSQKVV